MEGSDTPWRKIMARIPWPSTAVNVSILCKRPGGGGGSVGEGIFGRPEEAFDVGVSQRTSLEAEVLHIRLLPSLSSR